MNKQSIRHALKGILLASLAICMIAIAPYNVKAASPSISNKSVYLISGQKLQLSMKHLTTAQQKKVTYKSSKSTVASVSSTGKITAKLAGAATITARYNGKSYTCKVRVNKNWASYNGTYFKDFNTSLNGVEYYTVVKQSTDGRIKVQVSYFGVNGSPLYATNIRLVNLNNGGKGSFNRNSLAKGTVTLNRKSSKPTFLHI